MHSFELGYLEHRTLFRTQTLGLRDSNPFSFSAFQSDQFTIGYFELFLISLEGSK